MNPTGWRLTEALGGQWIMRQFLKSPFFSEQQYGISDFDFVLFGGGGGRIVSTWVLKFAVQASVLRSHEIPGHLPLLPLPLSFHTQHRMSP